MGIIKAWWQDGSHKKLVCFDDPDYVSMFLPSQNDLAIYPGALMAPHLSKDVFLPGGREAQQREDCIVQHPAKIMANHQL